MKECLPPPRTLCFLPPDCLEDYEITMQPILAKLIGMVPQEPEKKPLHFGADPFKFSYNVLFFTLDLVEVSTVRVFFHFYFKCEDKRTSVIT